MITLIFVLYLLVVNCVSKPSLLLLLLRSLRHIFDKFTSWVLMEPTTSCSGVIILTIICRVDVVVTLVHNAALIPTIEVLRCVYQRVVVIGSRGTIRCALPSLILAIKVVRLVLLHVLLGLLTIEKGLLRLRHSLISTSLSHLSCHTLALR